MRRATLALASVLLLAGFATACGDDDSSDAKDDETTSSATPTDSGSPTGDESSEASESPDTSESPDASESPSTPDSSEPAGDTSAYCDAVADASAAEEVEDLRSAVDKIADNLPDSASDEAEAGLEYLQDVLAKAKDMDDFTKRVQEGDEEEMAKTQEYGKFESTTCSTASDAPSVPAPTAS